MGTQPNDAFLELVETMKRSAAILRDAKVPFLLGGGLASWARGGPPTEHDVDLMLRERDVQRAEEALAAAGLRLERPPEGWLVKAWDGNVLVDLIFRPAGGAIGDEHFERATVLEVAAIVRIPPRMMPMTLVQTVKDEPTCCATSRLDTSSRIMMHRLLRNASR